MTSETPSYSNNQILHDGPASWDDDPTQDTRPPERRGARLQYRRLGDLDLSVIADRRNAAMKDGPRTPQGGYFYCNYLNTIYGTPASGKTWIAQAQATEMMNNGKRVLHLDFEMGHEMTMTRYFQMGLTEEAAATRLLYSDDFVDLGYVKDTNRLDQLTTVLINQCRQYEVDFVLIDSFSAAYSRATNSALGENDATAMQGFYSALHRVCVELKIPIVILAHTGRAGENIRGSSSADGALRVMWFAEELRPFDRQVDGAVKLSRKKDTFGVTGVPSGQSVVYEVLSAGFGSRNVTLQGETITVQDTMCIKLADTVTVAGTHAETIEMLKTVEAVFVQLIAAGESGITATAMATSKDLSKWARKKSELGELVNKWAEAYDWIEVDKKRFKLTDSFDIDTARSDIEKLNNWAEGRLAVVANSDPF